MADFFLYYLQKAQSERRSQWLIKGEKNALETPAKQLITPDGSGNPLLPVERWPKNRPSWQ